jgi:two-component system, NarL family, nitrate/nitrite response regulator NarL
MWLFASLADAGGDRGEMMQRAKVLVARQRAQHLSRYASKRFKIEEVSQMSGLVEAMVRHMPSVLLLPIDFPGLGGTKGIRDVRRLSPATKIVVLSGSSDATEELEVLRRGAKGYSGPVDENVLVKMIDKVQEGEVWAGRKTIGALIEELDTAVGDLSRREPADLQKELQRLTLRERQILRLLSEGDSNKEIATALGVSVSTVKAHLTKIFRKLGQPDRVRLALHIATAGGLLGDRSTRRDQQ